MATSPLLWKMALCKNYFKVAAGLWISLSQLTKLACKFLHNESHPQELCLLPPARRANFPLMSPQALHQWREEIVEALYFVAILLNIRSAQADIDKRSYNKSYQEDSPETVGAQGGVLGDGVIELHNLQTGGVDLNLKGWTKLKTNLLKRQSKKGLGADAH